MVIARRSRGTFKLAGLVVVASTLLHFVAQRAPGADQKPNVLLIVTDDQGWGDVRSHGNELIDTPVMDRVAAEGTRFDRFYVCPMCGPTRASLLTGRYNLRTGVSWVSHGLETMRLNEVTIADALARAGYATGCFGKWHNGEYGPYHPNHRGFQEFFGFCRGAWQNYFDPVLEHNRAPVKTEGYITDVLTDAVLEFIETNRGRPFFCYVPYNAPHHPFQIPGAYLDKYKRRGFNDKTACVYGMVENIDENFARILAKLDALKLTNDTIVIFTSDNGPWLPRYNGYMRGRKAEVDEGGVRVPFFIRWPGHVPAGRTVARIAAHIDLFPTILELCGVSSPATLPRDGRSLVPLLEGETANWPDRMIFTHQNRLGETHMTPGSVRTQQYRLVNRGDGYKLYDMTADPGQKQDVAEQHPAVTSRLASAYEAWYKEVTSAGVAAPPLPIGYPQSPVTAIQAEDSSLHGGLKFRNRHGWAHDSILNWKQTDDHVIWDLEVLRPGQYEVTLMYGCPRADVGARIEVAVGSRRVEATITRAHDSQSPESSPVGRKHVATDGPVWVRTWAPLVFPPIALDQGRAELIVRALDIPGNEAMTLKEARLHRLDDRPQ